ncbi:unnamed protein product [Eruca vesicaria subsp. sativa]|uniref:U1-type domain-containing protein n=1 Tax=Eruca vesicaria subsp. sativa TaxID=29727 RepID=A0ABC8L0A7_ERUVS|nr:unnamed protein product [Eruca vesicaria subsp. sativa]
MEFRFRATDTNRPPRVMDTPPSHSLNPNFAFVSALPVPGTWPALEGYNAQQREMEKAQIRQEIIAAETARRRELIAEVVHEMSIEREMAIKNIPEKENKIPMWITQRMIPHQNQDNNNLVKLKRTYSDPAMYTNPQNLVTSPMQQMPPLQIMLEATAAKETPLLESRKDKFIILDRLGPIGKDTQTRHRRAKRKAKDVEGGLKEPSKRKRLFKFWCDLCGVGAHNETIMRSHESGKKHKAATETAASSTSIVIAPQPEALTEVTNVLPQEVDKKAVKRRGKKREGENKEAVILECETCNIVTYSEDVMEIHKLGKRHKALLQKLYSEQLLETHRLQINASTVQSLDADPSEEESMVQFLGERLQIKASTVQSLDADPSEEESMVQLLGERLQIKASTVQSLDADPSEEESMVQFLGERLQIKASTVPVKSLDADPSEEESVVHFLGESL